MCTIHDTSWALLIHVTYSVKVHASFCFLRATLSRVLYLSSFLVLSMTANYHHRHVTWRSSSLFSRNFGFRLASSCFNSCCCLCLFFLFSCEAWKARIGKDFAPPTPTGHWSRKRRPSLFSQNTSRLSLDNVWQSCDVLGIFRFLANDVIIVNLWRFDVTSWQRLGYHLTTYRLSL